MNNTIDQTDHADTYRTFHVIPAEYMFFSQTFSRIEHMFGHKQNLNLRRLSSYQA